MKISFEDIQQRDEPYQLFLDSIKNEETKRKYKNFLFSFLKLIPNKIYQETLGSTPENRELNTLANHFVKLAQKDSRLVQNIIAAFIKEDKKLVENGSLNPNTVPNHIKPIRALLDANSIAIHWKTLHKLYPRPKTTEDRAYTREELQRMIEVSSDITDKLIIQLFSAAGFRLEAWDYFTWKDIVFFKNHDSSYKGAAVLVYRGDPESYWSFCTPECCVTLDHYRESWKTDIGRYPLPDEPLIKAKKFPVVRRLGSRGIRKRVLKIVKKIGLRPPLTDGKKRYDVPLDHGFRKYFNTMMRRAKVNYLDKEDMMGHSVGLERHYERYQEEDFERFPEYQKAIPFLTISDEARQELKIESLEKIKENLEEKVKEADYYKENIDKIVEDKAREYTQKFMENFEKMQDKQILESQNRIKAMDRAFLKKLAEIDKN